ncbi:hypothetical protein [Streptomyces sp. A1-5]|uniref:hypothetical protein n=1 Tax=Streptomyces sp. A1-5 TaxID=2738410 RepID=UPI001F3887A8|nr:hypothetical protein [Streptomyces sp. A1-5]UJB43624.1 hypothetical protein HRD51_25020 [Streptomyces sp. A1-5]
MDDPVAETEWIRKASSETLTALHRVAYGLPDMFFEGEVTPARAWGIAYSINRLLDSYGVPRPTWEEVVAASTPD